MRVFNEFVVLDVNCNVSRWFFVKKLARVITIHVFNDYILFFLLSLTDTDCHFLVDSTILYVSH